jgi:hypothetical protein
MPPRKKSLPTDLSLAEIKRLLQIKKRMIPLEERKGELEKGLATINAALKSLKGGKVAGRGRKKGRRKKATRTKVAKKRVARKKAARKAVRKAAGKVAREAVKRAGRSVARKKTRRVAKKGRRAAARQGKMTLEDVVASLIRANGKPVPFQTILHTILSRKLVATKSRNFANVLRRTLSTSKRIKRKGRGIYGLA